jgi:osmotically inducible protein OsmC
MTLTTEGQAPTKIAYTASATATGGGRRGGRAVTSDGQLDVTLQAPTELGGPGGGTNPEQLFAAGYGACFTGALHAVARKQGEDVTGAQVVVDIGFGPEGESFGITADLKVSVPGKDLATVQRLADLTHDFCPYSKAIRGNVPTTVTAVEA